MTKNDLSLAQLSNQLVIAEGTRRAATERQATAHLVAALAGLDAVVRARSRGQDVVHFSG